MSRRRKRDDLGPDPIRTEELVRPEIAAATARDQPPRTAAEEQPREDGAGAGLPGGGSEAAQPRRAGLVRPLLLALVLLAVTAGLVLGATRVPGGIDLSDHLGPPPQATAEAAPASSVVSETTLACPGPEQVGLEDPTVAEQRMVVAASGVVAPLAALPPGLDVADDGELVLDLLPDGPSEGEARRGTVLTRDIEDGLAARFTASQGLATGVAGAQWHLSQAEQRRGLTGAPCLSATTEAWLLAGGGQPGRVERVVLVNPGGSPITVRVQVFGAEGELAAPGGQGIVVAAGGRKVVLLDALAGGEPTPAIRVTSTGGAVAAALGDRWLQGTDDRGLELTVPAAPPATELVVPAVPMPEGPGGAQLRVVVPGETEAVVQVRALTRDGPARIEHDVTNIGGGRVADINISDVPPGTQALQITSDVPVLAAARVEQRPAAGVPADMAWVPATLPITELAGAPLFRHESVEVSTTLVLAAVEAAEVEVVTVDAAGDVHTESVSVPETGSTTVRLADATSVWVRPTAGSPHAALVALNSTAEGGPLVAGLPLNDLPLTREVTDVSRWLP